MAGGLTSPQAVKDLLHRYGVTPRKGWGQNFLVDRRVLELILDTAGPDPGDLVLEIGPGIGTLTRALADKAGRVVALEVDPRLVAVLGETLAGLENVQVIHADALEVDLQELARSYLRDNPGAGCRLVANLPYSITSPLLIKLVKTRVPFRQAVVTVQREVGERIAALPGRKEYGFLSLILQYYTRPELIAVVPPAAFYPPPKVESSIVRLRRLPAPAVDAEEELLFSIARAAFGKRRKTLGNALEGLHGLDKEAVKDILTRAGIDPALRGETLGLEEFGRIAREWALVVDRGGKITYN